MPAKPRGLGRGLDALLPKSDRGIQQVPIGQLSVSPFQPRKAFDEEALAELASSIADKGILQPLLVRPVESGYEIVAGERRFRAAQKAGLASVPAVVKDLDDQATLEVAIIENLQREDLTPIEEAEAFRQLLDFGMTQAEVAKAVGKSRSAVANTLRLLQLSAGARAALSEGTISPGHARAILAQPEEARDWAFRTIVDAGLTVRQAEALDPRPREKRSRSARAPRPHRHLEEELSRHVATKVVIRGEERGRVELHFHSEDELTRLLEVLGFQA